MNSNMINVSNISQYYTLVEIRMVSVIGQILDAYIFIYFIHKFFRVKQEKFEKSWIIAAAVLAIILYIQDILNGNNYLVWLLNIVFFPFLYAIFFYQGEIKIKFLSCMLFFTILFSLENVSIILTHFVAEDFLISRTNYFIMFVIRRVVMKIALFLYVKFLLRYTVKDHGIISEGYWYMLGGVCIMEYIILYNFMTQLGSDKQILKQNFIIAIFCSIIPILFYQVMVLMAENLNKTKVNMAQENFINVQEQYMTQILDLQDSLKKFSHDYKAHLFCLDHMLEEENYEQMHEYLQRLHGIEKETGNFVVYTTNNNINVILNQKKSMASKRKVEFKIKTQNVKIEHIAIYDFNMLLSNLCDNAIEAAQKAEQKWVELQIEKNRAYLKIEIKNSTNKNILKENPGFFTDKEEKEWHGLGMKIIQNVIEKYEGAMEFEGEENWIKIKAVLLDL